MLKARNQRGARDLKLAISMSVYFPIGRSCPRRIYYRFGRKEALFQ
jgi:hypothetical protein